MKDEKSIITTEDIKPNLIEGTSVFSKPGDRGPTAGPGPVGI